MKAHIEEICSKSTEGI